MKMMTMREGEKYFSWNLQMKKIKLKNEKNKMWMNC